MPRERINETTTRIMIRKLLSDSEPTNYRRYTMKHQGAVCSGSAWFDIATGQYTDINMGFNARKPD